MSRFSGRRALLIEGERGIVPASFVRQFDAADSLSFGSTAAATHKPDVVPRPQSISTVETVTLPYRDAEFDTVVICRCLDRLSDWRGLLRECARVLTQRGNFMVLEFGTRGMTELQTNAIDLDQLLRDRDALLGGVELRSPGFEDIRTELRLLEVHHIRLMEYTVQDFRCDVSFRQAFKRDCLDRIKSDLMATLGKLGRHRDAIEHRLIEVKRRIEVMGVEPQPIILIFGLKRTSYSVQESSLFAAEALAPISNEVANSRVEADAEKPRTDQLTSEVDTMQTSDLLSLLMSGGESMTRFERLATRLIKEYGSRAVADERDPNRLAETLRISRSRAMQIIAAFELGRRFFGKSPDDTPVLRGPEDVFRHVSDMSNLRREQFRGLYLNSRQRLVADEVISIGTLTSSVLHPREVFRPAVTHRAASLILVHNHPSGDPEPSAEDIELTRQIASAGKILGIDLLDHLIIGSDGWFSMKDAAMY